MAIPLTATDISRIQWVIKYLKAGSAGKFINGTSIEQLALVFGQSCGFNCGCPGTFAEGMRDTPFSTLLSAMLCLNTAAAAAGAAGAAVINQASFLLTAGTYGVLGASSVTNTGNTVINGDLGLSPGTSVVGFPPGVVTGTQHITDTFAAQAQLDLTAAYLNLAGRPGAVSVGADLAGLTITPGVYSAPSSLAASANYTLDAQGNADATWVFQIPTTFITSTGVFTTLVNGAKANNVFYQVGSSATLGINSVLRGSILALTSITANSGAIVAGRLLARNGAVTLAANAVDVPRA